MRYTLLLLTYLALSLATAPDAAAQDAILGKVTRIDPERRVAVIETLPTLFSSGGKQTRLDLSELDLNYWEGLEHNDTIRVWVDFSTEDDSAAIVRSMQAQAKPGGKQHDPTGVRQRLTRDTFAASSRISGGTGHSIGSRATGSRSGGRR